jgi:hypothetical protein
LLEKARNLRYQHALDLRTDLKRLQRDSTSGKVTAATVALPAAARRPRRIWVSAALVLVVALGGILTWLNRPLPPPRIVNTVQITHDGFPRSYVLTDGPRLYITEIAGAKQILVQASSTGGDTSEVTTPFGNIMMSDISPDHSQLLVGDNRGTEYENSAWVLPLPSGTPRRLGNIIAHWIVASSDGHQVAFAKDSDIYLAKADGSDVHKLTALQGTATFLHFFLDNTYIRFTLQKSDLSNSSIWEVRTDGTNLRPLLPGWHASDSQCCGVWSTDGRYYYFVNAAASGLSNAWVLREPKGFLHRKASQPFSEPQVFRAKSRWAETIRRRIPATCRACPL